MCGLFGWYLQRPDRRVIPLGAALSVLMDLRGDDSWGYYAYPWDHKEDKTAIDRPVYKKDLGTFASGVAARSLRGYTMLMAHSRSASVGAVSVDNAHPFIFDNVVGVHNGGVQNYKQLNKEYNRDFDVDSMHIFKHLSEGKSMGDIHGWGAINYIDRAADPRKINLCRWNTGSFSAARVYLRDGQRLGVVWASLEEALEQALDVAGFKDSYKMAPDLENEQAYFVGFSKGGDADSDAPDFWTVKGFKYPFGSRTYTMAETNQNDTNDTSANTSQYGTGFVRRHLTELKWCDVCFLLDEAQYHPEVGSHAMAPYLGGRRVAARNSSGTDEARVKAISDFKAAGKTEGEVNGIKYRVSRESGLLAVMFDDGKCRCVLCFTVMKKPEESDKLRVCQECYPKFAELLGKASSDVRVKTYRACLKASGFEFAPTNN